MNRDDIIRMAREAGGWKQWEARVMTPQALEHFAALVAAAEREACAKVCDAYIGADPIAAAIRARGQG